MGPPRSTSNSSDFFFLKLVTTYLRILCSNQFQKKKSELLLVDLNGPKYRLFLFRRVYWITRTPAFVWVGLDCIICWTVSSIPDQCAPPKISRRLLWMAPLFVLTTGVAEEHWTFLVSVTVGTLWDLFTS